MPAYMIMCRNCGKQRELILISWTRYAPITKVLRCEGCGAEGKWKKLPTSAIIKFKGEGFYATNHKENNDKKERTDKD